ncbi:MAG: hypothetical protein ACRDIU_08905, partial [Actinomycetota bacterium]
IVVSPRAGEEAWVPRRIPEGDSFIEQWNAMDRRDRLRIRRLVRIGRPAQGPDEAPLAVGYARFQLQRPWMKIFWVWFVPGLVLAMAVAARVHPVFVGVVLALGAQGVFTRINLGRAEKVNRSLLEKS